MIYELLYVVSKFIFNISHRPFRLYQWGYSIIPRKKLQSWFATLWLTGCIVTLNTYVFVTHFHSKILLERVYALGWFDRVMRLSKREHCVVREVHQKSTQLHNIIPDICNTGNMLRRYVQLLDPAYEQYVFACNRLIDACSTGKKLLQCHEQLVNLIHSFSF
jgi:hypothetical protein